MKRFAIIMSCLMLVILMSACVCESCEKEKTERIELQPSDVLKLRLHRKGGVSDVDVYKYEYEDKVITMYRRGDGPANIVIEDKSKPEPEASTTDRYFDY